VNRIDRVSGGDWHRPLCLLCNQFHATLVSEGLSQQNILYIPIAILQHTASTRSVFTAPDVKTDRPRSVISMDQQSIVMYLSLKNLNAVEIHNNLITTLKGELKSYSIIAYYICKPSFLSPKTSQPSESPTSIIDESDEAILLALFEDPFTLVWQLARRIHLHTSTVHDHLIHKLGFTVWYLRWSLHLLLEADKHTRA
jgi:hypothetical protein